jgi:hypothetical protein
MALASASLLDKAVASAHRDIFFSCRALMLGSAFVPENVRVTQSSGFTNFDCIGVLARGSESMVMIWLRRGTYECC